MKTSGRETFAPILYVMRYSRFEDALRMHNSVPQGRSSSIFTLNLQEAERFLFRGGIGLRHRQCECRSIRG
jgi:aldehyde dehydrogenase (NAD+)